MDNSQAPSETESKIVDVKFTGKGGEFFGIVIVNILLSIITLGIYSAWATVRTKKYFCSNTSIDDHVFSYLATPMQILIGRVLGVVFVIVFMVGSGFSPFIGAGLALVLFFMTPWLIISGLRFEYQMTSYRNVRFDFHATYGQAFITFILLPLAALLSLSLALPWVLKKMDEFMLTNISYGDKKLEVQLETKEYYKTSLFVFLASVGLIVLIYAFPLLVIGGAWSINDINSIMILLASMALFLPFFVVGIFIFINFIGAIYAVRIRNHILSNAEFAGVAKFNSTMKIWPFTLLVFTNTLAIVFSLGFAIPWVFIRTARFSAKHTQVEISKDADKVFDVNTQEESSLGGEIGNAFDVGVAIG